MVEKLKTYDPAQIFIICGGFPISGFQDGTFVSIDYNEAAFTLQIGSLGEGTRSKSNNKSAMIKLTLMQTSQSNDILSAFANLDEFSNAGVFPLLIKDVGGRAIYQAATAFIEKKPTAEYARESGGREWSILTDNLISFEGGH